MKMNFWWKVGLCVVAATSLTACGGGGGGSNTNKPRIRYVNGSPDAAALTFKLNGEVKASGVGYLSMSNAFKEEKANIYDVAVQEDGSGNPDLDAVATVFQNEKEYLVATVGLKNYGSEPIKRLRLVIPEIDLTVPNGSKSRIYVLHSFLRPTGFDTPNIDMRNPGDNPQYRVENIAFGSIGTLTIDASTQTFVVRRSGTESVYMTQTFTFASAGIYLAYVTGIEGETGTNAPKIEFVKLN